jgi:hypothetical protein
VTTNHGMDECDVIEILQNEEKENNAAIALAYASYDSDEAKPAELWDRCKRVGEDIRDYVIKPSAERDHNLQADRNTLSEMLFARMLGCVDWAEVGRHYIRGAMEQHPQSA